MESDTLLSIFWLITIFAQIWFSIFLLTWSIKEIFYPYTKGSKGSQHRHGMVFDEEKGYIGQQVPEEIKEKLRF